MQPSSASISVGGTYSPSITATGGVSLSYQWQYSSDNSSYASVANSTPANASYASATTNNMTLSGNVGAGTYYYKCYVTSTGSGCSAVLSSAGILTITSSSVYYFSGAGVMNNVSNWGTNSDGTGTNPSDLTSNNITYYVLHNGTTTPITNAAWTLGSGSKIIVGDGTNATNFTVAHLITGTVDVANNATMTITNTTAPTLGTLNSGSTIVYNGSAGQSAQATTFGNLKINNTSGVTAAGTISVSGDLTLTAGAFTPSASLNLAGNLIDNGGTFTHNNGTVTFTGSSSAINGTDNSETFYNLIVNKTAGQTLSTGGSMATITVDNDFTETLGNFTAPATMTITGNTVLTAGTFTAPSGTLSLAGNLTDNGGTFTHNSGTVTFTGNSSAVNGTDNSETFYNLIVNKTAGQTLSTGGSMATFTVNNNFTETLGNFTAPATMTITGNTVLTAGTFTAPSGTLSLAGNLTDNGGTFTHNNGTVTFTGSSSAINGTDNSETFYTMIVNKTAGQTLSTGGSMATITVGNTFTETLGNFTAPATMNVTGATTLTAGTFTAPSGTLTVSDNFSNNGATFTHNNGTVVMNGAGKTLGGTTSNTFYNLTASGATTLGASQTVNNTMSLGAVVTLGANNLTIGSSGVFSGYSTSNFVVTNSSGYVQQNGIASGAAAGKQIFPIGYTSASYTPVIINNTGTSDNFTAYVGNHRYAAGTSGSATTSDAVDRTWYLDEAVAGGSNVTLTMQWGSGLELTSFTRTNCFVSHYTGGMWDTGSQTGAAASGADPYTISRSGITSFSPFGVEDPSALPIELIDFTAKQDGQRVRLDWETGTEENNAYFTVERSIDGKNFEKVLNKDGAGNSNTTLYYFGYDNKPLLGISYYRLKQTDFDGKNSYSDIESVNFQDQDLESKIQMNIYPNPAVNNSFHIDFVAGNSETYYLSLYDEVGKLIHFEAVEAIKGKNTTMVNIPGLASGMYVLEMRSDTFGVEKQNVRF